ncbi:MAG: MoaD/ThiS family protein [Deltaproteobacteria bacterium]|nr:MoaD/ThiS family protein [Deltaproteobacteria bacterium]
MKIELRLYASLSRYMPEQWKNSSTVEIRGGMSVEELLESIKVPLDAVKMIFVNGINVREDRVLGDGDRVGVFPPVAGG